LSIVVVTFGPVVGGGFVEVPVDRGSGDAEQSAICCTVWLLPLVEIP
jgi:hypothetical protein